MKASLRSKGKTLDVSVIATRYGGGGHPNAAGFRMPADQFFSEVLKMVPKKGLEPPHLSAPEPKSGASTNSATFAIDCSRQNTLNPANYTYYSD